MNEKLSFDDKNYLFKKQLFKLYFSDPSRPAALF